GVCTDKQELHMEAIRSDEVAHAAEVQYFERGQGQNSRCSRNRHKDIHLTKGDLLVSGTWEKVSRGHSSWWQRAESEKIRSEDSSANGGVRGALRRLPLAEPSTRL
ncbi:MAG: hypothetical protein MI975_21780, partial [Cytophagales bacterium]|nr:hypothetical protein [Cytophagales bacterium]